MFSPCCGLAPYAVDRWSQEGLGQIRNVWASIRPKTRIGLTLEAFAGTRGVPKEGPHNWPGAQPILAAGYEDKDTGARGYGRLWEKKMEESCKNLPNGVEKDRCWAGIIHQALSYLVPGVTLAEWRHLVAQATKGGTGAIGNYPPAVFPGDMPSPGWSPTTPPTTPPGAIPRDPTIPGGPILTAGAGGNVLVFGALLLMAIWAGPRLQRMIR